MDEALERVVGVLSARAEVVGLCLFGSHARGKGTARSDVDVGIVLRFLHPYDDWLCLHAIEMAAVRRRLAARG